MFLVKLYRAVPPAYQRWALRGFATIVIMGYTMLVTGLSFRFDPVRLLLFAGAIAVFQWMILTALWEVLFHKHPAHARAHSFGFCVSALAMVSAACVVAGLAYWVGQLSTPVLVSVIFAVACFANLLRQALEHTVLPAACPAKA